MRFVLVLHGEADHTALSETGRLQARAVGAELARHSATVVSSPAPHAREAATIIAETSGSDSPAERPGLGQPEHEGFHESTQESGWAIIEAAKIELDPEATLVMVTHEVNIRLLVCRALAMPLSELDRFALEPGSMTTIEWRTQPRDRLLLGSLNEVCHLDSPA